MKRLHALLAIAAGLAVPSVPSAAPVFPRTPFLAHQLLEEPYPWRVPAASGKLNALIIAHSWTTPEFAEFAKRFDIRYDLVPVWSEESLERSWQSAETRAVWSRVTDLLARNRYDCILVTGYGDMPAAVWEGIYRQSVEGSAGLVFFNTGGPYGGMVRRMERDGFVSKADILQSPPVAAVSWTGVYDEQVRVETGALAGLVETAVPLGGKVVFGVRKGRTRYVLFNWEKAPYFYWSIHHGISPAGLAFPFDRVFPMADHIFALAAKAVFWSAGRTPAVRFAAVAPSDTVLASGARDAAAFSATVANGGRGAFSG